MPETADQMPTAEGGALFASLVDPLRPAFAALDAFLEGEVNAFEPEVRPLVRYCFGHSGKKLRPLLVFSTGLDQAGAAPDALIRAAAIVELVHLATLVHDDILDEAEMRHRSETVVARHGPHVAVLLGDTLFAHALHLASGFPDVEVCRAVSLATRQVCSGEIAQTFARGGELPTPAAYYRIIDLKTAELFRVSAHLGGYLSGFTPKALAAAAACARHLGIAYEIYDAAADIFADEAVAGKTLGTDLATGKLTLPVLLWVDGLKPEARTLACKALAAGDWSRHELQQRLLSARILDATGTAFSHQIQLAREALELIPGHWRRNQMGLLAEFVERAWNKFYIR